MKTLILNKSNFYDILQLILEKINKWLEVKIIVEETNELNPEVAKKRYRDSTNPEKGEYDIIKREFDNVEEAVEFLRK